MTDYIINCSSFWNMYKWLFLENKSFGFLDKTKVRSLVLPLELSQLSK